MYVCILYMNLCMPVCIKVYILRMSAFTNVCRYAYIADGNYVSM